MPEEKKDDFLFELYKILVEEVRHIHNQGYNKFRMYLTVNVALIGLISAMVAYFASMPDEKISCADVGAMMLLLNTILIAGLSIAFYGLCSHKRNTEIVNLRYIQLRRIELTYGKFCDNWIFIEGFELIHKNKYKSPWLAEYSKISYIFLAFHIVAIIFVNVFMPSLCKETHYFEQLWEIFGWLKFPVIFIAMVIIIIVVCFKTFENKDDRKYVRPSRP